MAQGNFLQSLFNRQPQMQPMIRPEDLPAYQAGQAKIAEQRAQPTLMNGLRNLVQDPTSALFGKQSPVQEQPIIGVDMTQQDYNNLQQQGLAPQISMGAAQNPRTGGLLNDIASGFNENANTPFAASNLEPQKDKGFATQLGEGLGTLGRFAASPTGRGLLMAGLVGATGGGGINAINAGLQAGVGNQQARTQNQFYRNQLQNEGVDTSNIQGNITPEMYKNQSLGKYRVESLRVRNQIAQQTDNTKRAKMIIDGFTNNIFSEAEAIEEAKKYGMTIDDLKASNQTRNADVNQYLAPARKRMYESAPAIAGARLGLQQAEFGVDAPYKQAQTMKLMEELGAGGIPLRERTQMQRGVQAVESQVDRFTDTFKGLPTKAESYTAGQARRLTGMQTPSEANFNSQRTLLFNKIARELGGEKGVLSDQDIQRINEALPNLTDSYQQKQAKMQAVYDLMGDVKNRYGMTQGGGNRIQPFVPNANLTPIPRNAMGGGNVKPRQTSKPKAPTKGAKEKTYYF